VAVVTALRPTRGGVAVDLDGVTWRTFAVAVVVEAGLGVGLELIGPRARALARARRRHRAEQVAVRALSRREHSRRSLDMRLERAGVGDAAAPTCSSAPSARLVDDARFAGRRARQLAERGAATARSSTTSCDRESTSGRAGRASRARPEADRARAIVERAGGARATLRYLARGVLRGRARGADCGYRERSATMSGLHPDFPANAQFRTRRIRDHVSTTTFRNGHAPSPRRDAGLEHVAADRIPRAAGAGCEQPRLRRGQTRLLEEWRCSR
jgi:hypothetical protein